MRFQSPSETWTSFSRRISDLGAIVEAFIEGDEKRSPSVQGCISPTGEVEILSTHDQILGGSDGQVYLGCTFPADASYRFQLQELGLKIGHNLAAKGVLERFGVDFVAVRQPDDSWDLQAIEINLRKGGTTHPLLMDIIAHHQLHFESSTETGTVFHLMGCLSEFGKVGLTSIGNSPQEAQAIYDRVVAVIDRETTT